MSAGTEKPWTINGTLRGFYDDNYNTQPSGTNRVGSFGFEVLPSVSIKYADGPDTLTAAYYYSLRYYGARPNGHIDQDHRFELALNHRLNSTDALSLVETFVDSQEPEILNASSPASTPLRANGDNFHNIIGANYVVQVNDILGFVFGYVNNWYRYTGNQDAADAAAGNATYDTLLNRLEHSFTIDSRWKVDDETTAVFGYQFQWVDHMSGGSLLGSAPNTPYVPATARNLYSHYIYVGVDHNFSDTLRASARAGLVVMDFYNENITPAASNVAAPDGVSPYADLSLNWDYLDNGSFKVGFTQSQNTTDVETTFNELTSSLYASLTQVLTPLSPNLTAALTGQFEYASYNGGIDGSDKIYLFGINLSYQFNKYFSSEVGYNYDKLDSTIGGRNYDRNRVYIGATASY
jgi:hypothetical protein